MDRVLECRQSRLGPWNDDGSCIDPGARIKYRAGNKSLSGGKSKMSNKKGAKGMPSEGPGKHNPSKPQKSKSDAPVFNKAKGGMKNERPRKTRI